MYNNPYNYYPYMNMNYMPRMNGIDPRNISQVRPNGIFKGGLFRGLSNIKWGDVLNNTQKTLNVINQAIPVYYQIKPIFSNVRSLGKLMSIFNEDDTNNTHNNNDINKNNNIETTKKENSTNSPTFFIN